MELFDNKIEALTGTGVDKFNSRKLKWSDIIVTEDLETDRQFSYSIDQPFPDWYDV